MNGKIMCGWCNFEIRPNPRTRQVAFRYLPLKNGSSVPVHHKCFDAADAAMGDKDRMKVSSE